MHEISTHPRRFLLWFLASAAGAAVLVMALLVVLDPYDRGHGLFARKGTIERGPRTANVSRARDRAFNAAVIGNSHSQLLSPERMKALTGLDFVQLTVPATTPREQFAMLDWFMLNHAGSFRALVLGTDFFWCTPNPALPVDKPFPFWLYEPDRGAYFSGLFRMQAARLLPRRIAFLTGRIKPQRRDGYWDYEELRTRDDAFFRAEVGRVRLPGFWNETGRFPAVARLAGELAKLPPAVSVVLLVPPLFAGALPEAGSRQAEGERACVAALQRIADARPGTFLVDERRDDPAYRDAALFWDASHYGRSIAERLEGLIARHLSKK